MAHPPGPSIGDAMKNYVSLVLAEGLTAAEGAPQLSAAAAQAMARSFLQAVNAAEPGAEKATRRPDGRALLARPGFFDAVSAAVLDAAAASTAAGLREDFAAFLADFERSFKDGVVERADVELGELVWASDYASALRERGARRAERAAQAAAGAAAGQQQSQQELEALVRGRMQGAERARPSEAAGS